MPPIKPNEVDSSHKIPEEVFEVINELIKAKLSPDGVAHVKFKEAASAIATKLGISVRDVYDQRYMDIEEAYRKVGWRVKEDRPGFNESYDGYWEFTKRRGRRGDD